MYNSAFILDKLQRQHRDDLESAAARHREGRLAAAVPAAPLDCNQPSARCSQGHDNNSERTVTRTKQDTPTGGKRPERTAVAAAAMTFNHSETVVTRPPFRRRTAAAVINAGFSDTRASRNR